MKDKIVEICKKALLKQLHPMIYQANTYPVEAVSKATILSLDKLVESDIAHLYSAGEEVSHEPFNGFWIRLKEFISNVEVNDAMSEEEKGMILSVCDSSIKELLNR